MSAFDKWLEFYSPGADKVFTEGEITPLRNAWDAALTLAVDACNKLESFGKEDHRDSWMGNAVTAIDKLRSAT